MSRFEACWWRNCWWSYGLWPVTLLFRLLSAIRRFYYSLSVFQNHHFHVPVIVVGNITVGGTGKTPFVIWLVRYLIKQGYKPGIVARGYGGQASVWPQMVTAESDPIQVGDEPVLLASTLAVPMVVAPDRYSAVKQLLSQYPCDVVISDDGLQHYALPRDLEIIMIDGQRRFGNGFCLPAGPLREPISRLKQADFLITTGQAQSNEFPMTLMLDKIHHIHNDQNIKNRKDFSNVHAVAGIGHPQRFFTLLEQLGLKVIPHAFDDHYSFTEKDLQFDDDLPVLMTEKDAVKCHTFTVSQCWVVCVKADLPDSFCMTLNQQLNGWNNHG